MDKTCYICTLSKELRERIVIKLLETDIKDIDISRAMDGRLCDLEDLIQVDTLLEGD